ncbi:hypothetical protein G3T14_21320 [Methylobacterium sp. BTF04]|uniref:siphovirus Gp157 family protein n=1 Tax=Methylobacterium sp. BTF04 TaxID=2708300 RepID=UPI0013CF8279|nr:siphovirus Gp157 family protein [Methylobacterium sp. BTF04]NEU14627.1 hypothetical protein [Methylobacterium sp. BTF04]
MSAAQPQITADEGATTHKAKPKRAFGLVRNAALELEAAQVLRDQLSDLAGGDEDFIRDSMEGEIDLDRLVGKLVASIAEDESLAAGLKDYREGLEARLKRFTDRAGHKRSLLVKTLEIAGRPSIETPAGTVSLRPVPPKLIEEDASEIPSEFWVPSPPKLDRKAVLDALKGGRVVPGASLNNGGQTVSIKAS